jgi:hypothetical protein
MQEGFGATSLFHERNINIIVTVSFKKADCHVPTYVNRGNQGIAILFHYLIQNINVTGLKKNSSG